jgi:hypothetical protein
MSDSVISPLHSETVVLEPRKKLSKRITKKRTSALSNESEDIFDPLTFNTEQQKAYNKTLKAREKYHNALEHFRSLFPTTGGRKTRGRKTRGRKYR